MLKYLFATLFITAFSLSFSQENRDLIINKNEILLGTVSSADESKTSNLYLTSKSENKYFFTGCDHSDISVSLSCDTISKNDTCIAELTFTFPQKNDRYQSAIDLNFRDEKGNSFSISLIVKAYLRNLPSSSIKNPAPVAIEVESNDNQENIPDLYPVETTTYSIRNNPPPPPPGAGTIHYSELPFFRKKLKNLEGLTEMEEFKSYAANLKKSISKFQLAGKYTLVIYYTGTGDRFKLLKEAQKFQEELTKTIGTDLDIIIKPIQSGPQKHLEYFSESFVNQNSEIRLVLFPGKYEHSIAISASYKEELPLDKPDVNYNSNSFQSLIAGIATEISRNGIAELFVTIEYENLTTQNCQPVISIPDHIIEETKRTILGLAYQNRVNTERIVFVLANTKKPYRFVPSETVDPLLNLSIGVYTPYPY